MPTYNVHLYREMRLFFPGITASTHEEAAQLAAQQPTDDAASIDECEGVTRAALVDVIGDDAFEHSRMIDFDARPAAPPGDAPLDIPAITAILAAQGYVAVFWHRDDVKSMRPDLTDVQCMAVLQRCVDRHDGDTGLTWDVLDYHAAALFPAPVTA